MPPRSWPSTSPPRLPSSIFSSASTSTIATCLSRSWHRREALLRSRSSTSARGPTRGSRSGPRLAANPPRSAKSEFTFISHVSPFNHFCSGTLYRESGLLMESQVKSKFTTIPVDFSPILIKERDLFFSQLRHVTKLGNFCSHRGPFLNAIFFFFAHSLIRRPLMALFVAFPFIGRHG